MHCEQEGDSWGADGYGWSIGKEDVELGEDAVSTCVWCWGSEELLSCRVTDVFEIVCDACTGSRWVADGLLICKAGTVCTEV